MDEKTIRKQLRHNFGVTGWSLLIYHLILETVVSVVLVLDVAGSILRAGPARDFGGLMNQIISEISRSAASNGWGYLITCAIGLGAIFLWKGKDFLGREVFAKGRPMKAGTLGVLLCLVAACQVFYQLLYLCQEALLAPFGKSMSNLEEMLNLDTDSISIFLYAGLVGPIMEELIFRGIILRILRPNGKKIAIVGSAFLFGLFHGNLIQTPFAFCVGLVLGYVAVEYSILWSMVLHIFNNLILGDLLIRILPGAWGETAIMALLLVMTLVALVYGFLHRRRIQAWWQSESLHRRSALCFFTSPGVVTFTVLMLLNLAVTFLAL